MLKNTKIDDYKKILQNTSKTIDFQNPAKLQKKPGFQRGRKSDKNEEFIQICENERKINHFKGCFEI